MYLLKHETETKTITFMFKHDDYTWDELLEEYRNFLNACGFIVPRGEIEVKELEDRNEGALDWLNKNTYHEEDKDEENTEFPEKIEISC